MPPQSIVLATDLSSRCDRALDRAIILAGNWKARLTVLNAVQEATDDFPWTPPIPDATKIAKQRIYDDIQFHTPYPALDVVILKGEPGPVILGAVKELAAEMVITGVARDETLGRILLGTTVETLIDKSPVPVLTVKARPRAPYRSIVVATDFSEASRDALKAALRLFPEAGITLFHAYDVRLGGLIEDKTPAWEAARDDAMNKCHDLLASISNDESALLSSMRVRCEHGDVADALKTFSDAESVDLVVVGTNERGRLSRLLLGSVASRLMNRLSVDVLVVPQEVDNDAWK